MDGLLFLGAIIAVAVVVVKSIIDDGRQKQAATMANAARPSMLQKERAETSTRAHGWRRR
jgi:hypothetical protein